MYDIKSLSTAELEKLKKEVDKEFEERIRRETNTNRLSSIRELLEEMEKQEDVKNATLIYYTNINPQFSDEYKGRGHWNAYHAVLSKKGLDDLENYYIKDDFCEYGKHIYIFIDEGPDQDTTGGSFQGQIKAYYRKFRVRKVTI